LSPTSAPPEAPPEDAVTVERRGHVRLMGLNRPGKRNAFNLAMIDELAATHYELENDDDIRYGTGSFEREDRHDHGA
jgi:hypothetical protein